MDEFPGGAVEPDAAVVEHEELHAWVDAVVRAVLGDRNHAFGGVVAVGGEGEGVLQAMGDEQRCGVGDVALLHDQLDDGGGGDGIEAAGGGVVEDEVGVRDDGTGDGDAAAHASGDLRRELCDCLLQLDELERLDDAAVGVIFGNMLFVEAVGDVVFDVDGVEEGGLLEDHADVGAQRVEVALGHGGDLLAEDADGAGVGFEQAVGEFEQHRLAAAGGAKDDEGLATIDGEGDVLEHGSDVEGDGDVFELDYGEFDHGSLVAGRGDSCGAGSGDGCGHRSEAMGRAQLPKIPIMARVTSRSTTMMRTEETTTAWVVARPTPWVPPVVFMPK